MILAQKWLSAGAKRRYTVTFNLNGGKIDGSEGPIIVYNVPHGRKIGRIKPSTDPTKHLEDGRIFPFTGWDTSDETRVTSDMTVSAVYSTECLLDYYESNDPSKNGEYIFIPGIYEIKLVGAGGKAAVGMWPGTVTPSKTNCFVAAGGGSGALLVGQVTLLANTRFTVNIGSAQNNSKLTSGSWLNLDVPHGSNGSAGWFWATGGAGGDKDSIVSTGLTNPTTTSGSAGTEMTHVATWDGDYGAWASGGASTIANTNYGAGGWAESAYLYRTATAGEAGYVLIHKVGEAPKTKVTFMDGDGDIFKMVLNVIKGTLLGTIKPTETPLKSSTDMYDYTFKNWDKTDAYEINEDTVVNSVFEEHLRKFTVTFKLNGGNIGGSTEDVVVENVTYGTLFKDIKPSNPTLENYNFTGWGMDDDTPVTYSTNVTAQYELAVEILQQGKTYDTTGMDIGTYNIPSYGYIKTSACGTERGSTHGWRVTFYDANGSRISRSNLSHPTPTYEWREGKLVTVPRYGQSTVAVPSNAVKATFTIYTDDQEYYWIEYIKWTKDA